MKKKKVNEDNFMNYVDKRLDSWARWYSKGNHYGVGYHSETIEYALMTVGVLISSTSQKPLPCNEEAEEIEEFVTEMSKHDDKIAEALRVHYFKNKKTRERSDELEMSATQFKVYVKFAKHWLAGRLSAYYKKKSQ